MDSNVRERRHTLSERLTNLIPASMRKFTKRKKSETNNEPDLFSNEIIKRMKPMNETEILEDDGGVYKGP